MSYRFVARNQRCCCRGEREGEMYSHKKMKQALDNSVRFSDNGNSRSRVHEKSLFWLCMKLWASIRLKDLHIDLKRFKGIWINDKSEFFGVLDFYFKWWSGVQRWEKVAIKSRGEKWFLHSKICTQSKFQLIRSNFQIDVEVLKWMEIIFCFWTMFTVPKWTSEKTSSLSTL